MYTVHVWSLVVTCFNRYMVECEYSITFIFDFTPSSFNRYMVECESVHLLTEAKAAGVLIDTWWNVNLYSAFKDS